eukprot:m.8512 g.8512  ORF g.8512 m.8512 type:complete len:480 (+) comp2547_c0_seq1:107-1546(+)
MWWVPFTLMSSGIAGVSEPQDPPTTRNPGQRAHLHRTQTPMSRTQPYHDPAMHTLHATHTKRHAPTLVQPSWDMVLPRTGAVCTDASTSHAGPHGQVQNNTRWSFYALPAGDPPPGGWPIYVEMMAEIQSPGDWRHPEDTPQCGDGWVPPPDGWSRPPYNLFDPPAVSMASCFDTNGDWLTSFSNCSFFQKAGQLWAARLHQYLTANGIAVLALNPYAGDVWEWDDPSLPVGTGQDQPYFAKLFDHIQSGTYGNLSIGTFDSSRTIFSGFSDGAQMTSWVIELAARQALPPNVSIAAAVFLSGGSHRCYLDPPNAVGDCAARCSKGPECNGGAQSRGCSLTADPLCCDYCCPANYTEDYYAKHPEEYIHHPPTFLAQSEASDFNADLCAARLYYETLQAHGVRSELVLLPAADARCSCVGSPNATSPAGRSSPLARECALQPPEPPGPRGNCVDHVWAFAKMVEPLTMFLLDVLHGLRL